MPVLDAAGVLTERHVHLPMQLVLDAPVVPQHLAITLGRTSLAADETPLLTTRFPIDRPLAVAFADHRQFRPRLAVSDSLGFHDYLVQPSLLPPMPGFFRLMPVVLHPLTVRGVDPLETGQDVLLQLGVVVFHRQR